MHPVERRDLLQHYRRSRRRDQQTAHEALNVGMLRKFFLFAALSVLAAAGARAQSPESRWSAWQPATAPDGSAHPVIQFRWRSDPPCTEVGCQLSIQIRNVSHAPVGLRCWVYFDPPPPPYEDEARPVVIDVRLKPSGSHGSKRQTGDTTNPLIIPGVRITGVVVQTPNAK